VLFVAAWGLWGALGVNLAFGVVAAAAVFGLFRPVARTTLRARGRIASARSNSRPDV